MAKAKKVSAFIVLDRSGSMSGSRWENAIGAINTYVAGLVEDGAKGDVTVVAFDSNGGYTSSFPLNNGNMIHTKRTATFNSSSADLVILRDKVDFKTFKPIEINECTPRGGTPLYDATAKVIDTAETSKNARKIVIIMTDGEENSSTEYSLAAIKAKIEKCKTDGWEVVYLGAEFNADSMAGSMGIAINKVINVGDKTRFNENMRSYSTATMNYAAAGTSINTTTLREAEAKKNNTV